jgi:hypothetical protein
VKPHGRYGLRSIAAIADGLMAVNIEALNLYPKNTMSYPHWG